MDELNQWHMEEAARQAREFQEWLETSGVIDALRHISEQHQAIVNVLNTPGLIAAMDRTAAVVRALQDSASHVSFQFQATTVEMIAALSGAHQALGGIGTSLAVTWGEAITADSEPYQRQFTLPAGQLQEADSDTLLVTKEATARVLRQVLSYTQADDTAAGAEQVTELETLPVTVSGQSFDVFNSLQNWSVERGQDSSGNHRFTFNGYGESARTLVDWLYTATQSVVAGDQLSDGPPSLSSAEGLAEGAYFNAGGELDPPPWGQLTEDAPPADVQGDSYPRVKGERRIANELVTGVTRENVWSLVRTCANGMGYEVSPVFPEDSKGTSRIILFNKKSLSEQERNTLAPSLGKIVITPRDFDKSVRIRIYCVTDWPKTGLDLSFTPCEVAAAIMRYLLRAVEGEERANDWRAPWETEKDKVERNTTNAGQVAPTGRAQSNVVFTGWDEKALRGTPQVALSPQRVAQIIEQITLSMGYTIAQRYDLVGSGWHFTILDEGEELGRITAEPTESYPRYFSTSMPQLTGLGKRPMPKKNEGISMEPVHPTAARFGDLVEAIHERLIAEIDFAERLGGRTAETVTTNSIPTISSTNVTESVNGRALSKAQAESDVMPVGGRYGTNRDMSLEDVQQVLRACLSYRKQGGKVTEFHRRWHFNSGTFELGTLRDWLKNQKKYLPLDT